MTGDVSNDPAKVAAFARIFANAPSQDFIANLECQIVTQRFDSVHFPVSLTNARDDPNCYICCPSAAYVDYAREETRHFLSHPMLRAGVLSLISAARPLLRASGLDHQVQVNDWLLSTNPAPKIEPSMARSLRNSLVEQFPDRAIVIRSLNDIADVPSMRALNAAGFRLLPARQIYVVSRGQRPTKNLKADLSLLRRTQLVRVKDNEFGEKDYNRCSTLYRMLYIDKYTPLNPQYTSRYIKDMHPGGLMKLEGLRDKNRKLLAVTGLFENGATLTQPIVGYDTSCPKSLGLYRMIMAIGQQYAARQGLFFNVSAGAADFKRRRGATASLEYTAVYVRHLPMRQQLAVAAIETLLRRVGIPLMQRFRL